MRSLFLGVLMDLAANEGLGIARDCLRLVRDEIDRVIAAHSRELADPATFSRAYADFQQFVARMVESAKRRSLRELHEPTFHDAKGECGLIFWCE